MIDMSDQVAEKCLSVALLVLLLHTHAETDAQGRSRHHSFNEELGKSTFWPIRFHLAQTETYPATTGLTSSLDHSGLRVRELLFFDRRGRAYWLDGEVLKHVRAFEWRPCGTRSQR
jgi:hypothetical protein